MDDREKAELNKQKKLVDCVSHLNSVLEAFERLENYKATVLPIIDGFDLTHSDTYLELTENIKRELFYIKFFSNTLLANYLNIADYVIQNQIFIVLKTRKIEKSMD
ncbi:MAG: hypothetical protein KME09_21640 [Pleurocapsa minor HA4230-MV1]|jgi:hypothetical protein|nr:hypothetical protein [Pleurocapsa minor HA4230-MV1]